MELKLRCTSSFLSPMSGARTGDHIKARGNGDVWDHDEPAYQVELLPLHCQDPKAVHEFPTGKVTLFMHNEPWFITGRDYVLDFKDVTGR